MVYVRVRFKYASKGMRPSVFATETLSAEGRSESAALAALRRRYPNREVIVLAIE